MRKHKTLFAAAALYSLTACAQGGDTAAELDMVDVETAEAAAETSAVGLKKIASSAAADGSTNEIPVSQPQIAYSYDYGFRLPSAEIPKAQQQHIALCNQVPEMGCRVLNMSNSGGEGDYANGRLHLEVAAPKARVFGEKLADAIDDNGGSQIAASISGEDLSKQIVDTEARLRSRLLLSQRLTELLRTRKGSVAELVEAERAVTDVNEEIDQARSWLKEMRAHVAYSKVMISYQSGAPGSGGFTRPIREALGGVASALGYSVGAAITVIAVTLPWILLIALGVFLRRRFKAKDRSFWGRKIGLTDAMED
ncbi:MAG: DUF4349 domain-containing protein [Parasphingorhabdus sp.]|uniref:DUF4349 domain-containing protein n=1 Tax=Parasphingorhabdus sp. TaxID=2709688 RepID=UPI003298A4AF